jgi:hypothetical protein
MKCYVCDQDATRACKSCGRFCCAWHCGDTFSPRCQGCRADFQFRLVVSGVVLFGIAGLLALATPYSGFAFLVFGLGAFGVWLGRRRFRSAAEEEQAARGWPADAPAPEELTSAEPAPCLECGATIPPGATRCPACGWSYAADDGRAGR